MAQIPTPAALKSQMQSSEAGAEEAVTVNTRALIDKVLARYSSEHTTLRELIQNAADANATTVEVRYYSTTGEGEGGEQPGDSGGTEGGGGVLELVRKKVKRLIVKNDGIPFRDQDWDRLKRIAEGNPSDEKIGAFGVGFYSVFADCDEPFVTSGNSAMAFFWRGNSLYTRRATLENRNDEWTTFLLDSREPMDVPDLRGICKFFATSLTFVQLERISLWMDDVLLCELRKKELPPITLSIPKDVHPKTKEGIAQITAVETANVQLDAKYMNVTHYREEKPEAAAGAVTGLARLFFGRAAAPQKKNHVTAANLEEYTTANIFLRIAKATVNTSVGAKFAAELERATKKPPPKKTTIACLTMSKDEVDASESDSEIFSGVVPTKNGRIFIGFPTHQTTGIKAHFAAHSVIPTVERENIDLNARIVKTWNAELLRAAGILARIIYVDEMDTLRKRAAGLKTADLEPLYAYAVHIMRQFTFEDSTPSVNVGNYIAEAFWSATYYTSIELLSTRGVMPSTKVRLADKVTFLEGLPLLPEALIKGAPEFVDTLRRGGFISEITLTDIQNSLADRPLSGDQPYAFLKWLSVEIQTGKLDDLQAPMLLSGAIAMVPVTNDKGEEVENGLAVPVSLAEIKYYVNASKLAGDIPLPPDCLPFVLTKKLAIMDFDALGWKELDVARWVGYVAARKTPNLSPQQNIELSPAFASKVLSIVSKNWDKLPGDQKTFIIHTLGSTPCIPTKQGMKLPKESYFPNVKLFPDLPVIHEVRNVKDKFLAAIGVRKTVELTLVFERLMGGGAEGEKWSHVDLIKYLTGVRDDIPAEDIRKLHSMAICKAVDSNKLYRVSELYEPLDSLRSLGLPLLQWPGEWRPQSPEVAFLRQLGLRKFPKEATVLQIAAGLSAAGPDSQIREKALQYLVSEFHTNLYSTAVITQSQIAFLPLQNAGSKDRLVRPRDCFTNQQSALLGFPVLRKDLAPHASKLGVEADPPAVECVSRLINAPPATAEEAKEKFTFLLPFLPRFNSRIISALGTAPIIPLASGTRTTPKQCYLGPPTHKYAALFPFIDLGPAANSFLQACGCRAEPDTRELALRLAGEPAAFADDEARCLGLLRAVAEEWATLKQDRNLVSQLKSSACLGAYRGEGEGKRTFVLARASDVFLIDDISLYALFRGSLLAAPEDDSLETLYAALGSRTLSGSVDKTAAMGNPLPGSREDLRKLVIERVALFLEGNSDTILRDGTWIERNLVVKAVSSISYRITFRYANASQTVHRTAAVTLPPGGGCTLWVTDKVEFYDIAQGIVRLLLKRPKPHSALLLESLLATELERLVGRGYNVARILRRKEEEERAAKQKAKDQAEKRAAEQETQRKALQESRSQDQKKAIAAGVVVPPPLPPQQQQNSIQTLPPPTPPSRMPGAFVADSPPRPIPAPPPIATGNFLTRGLNRFSQLLNDEPKPQPPPVTQNDKHLMHTYDGTNTGTPESTSATLQGALQSLHPPNIPILNHSSEPEALPPITPTTCTIPKSLTHIATTPSGTRVYAPSPIAFDPQLSEGVETFAQLLAEVMAAFGRREAGAVGIYMGERKEGDTTIAFNSNGAVYCNYAFFEGWTKGAGWQRGKKKEAFKFWFVTLCHELAHNLVREHGARHGFWTESFMAEFFEPAAERIRWIEMQESSGKIFPKDPPAYSA